MIVNRQFMMHRSEASSLFSSFSREREKLKIKLLTKKAKIRFFLKPRAHISYRRVLSVDEKSNLCVISAITINNLDH